MNAEVISLGCRLNIAESETIRALLAGERDVVVVNSCAVTAEAVRQTRQAIRKARRARPDARLLVTGCAAEIERDPLFPERVNVNVATIEDDANIRLRVWERGTGITRACGTGACATAVAAMRRGLVQNEVTVTLPGGALLIEWGEDGRITMTGPATESFRGTFDWGEFA